MIVTIDGLSTNGKSTIGQKLAKKLNINYFNTGLIYRFIALKKKNKEPLLDFLYNDIDNNDQLFSDEISLLSTEIANDLDTKKRVDIIQKEYAKNNSFVMEGRDIGTRVFPQADYKFYLYTDFNKRVERLHNLTKDPYDVIETNLRVRDEIDIKNGNFVKPINAIEIDTTNKTIDEIVDFMYKKIISNK